MEESKRVCIRCGKPADSTPPTDDFQWEEQFPTDKLCWGCWNEWFEITAVKLLNSTGRTWMRKKPVEYSVMRCLHCDKAVEAGDEDTHFRSYCRQCAKTLFKAFEYAERVGPLSITIDNVTCAKHGTLLGHYDTLGAQGRIGIRVEPCPTCLGDAVADVLVGPNPDDTDRRHP